MLASARFDVADPDLNLLRGSGLPLLNGVCMCHSVGGGIIVGA